jgi:hypothetical protein
MKKFTVMKENERTEFSNSVFTEEEVKTAKATRAEIIRDDIEVLKAIYMAGEIYMWDEMQEQNKQLQEDYNIQNHKLTDAIMGMGRVRRLIEDAHHAGWLRCYIESYTEDSSWEQFVKENNL